MRIEDALERFILQLTADGRSEHTIAQYRRHVRLLASWARDVRPGRDRLEDLDHEAVAAFLAAPVATSRVTGVRKLATSANCLRSSLRCFLSYCHGAGYIPTNPGRLVRRAITSPPPPKGLSPDEETRLLEVLRAGTGFEAERDFAMFRLMLRAGLRVGSAVGLKVEDVDLERRVIEIRAKGDRRDRVLIAPDVGEHLRSFIGDRTSGPLFAGRDGTALTTRHVARRLRGWGKKAGIPRRLSPHQLRHACGQRIYAKTGDVLIVKEVLRHRSIASTMVYMRIDEEQVRRVI